MAGTSLSFKDLIITEGRLLTKVIINIFQVIEEYGVQSGRKHNNARDRFSPVDSKPYQHSPFVYAQNHFNECKKKVKVFLEEGLPELKICIEDGANLTCGWLITEVTRQYAYLID